MDAANAWLGQTDNFTKALHVLLIDD